MALIKCSECGKEISDKANICVHCGNPIQQEKKVSTLNDDSSREDMHDSENVNIKKDTIIKLVHENKYTTEKEEKGQKTKRTYGIFNGIYENDIDEIKKKMKISILPITIICLIAFKIIFKYKVNFGLYLFVNILCIFGLLLLFMSVLLLKYWYKAANNIEKERSTKGIILFIVLLPIIIIIIIAISSNSGNNSSPQTTDAERNACYQRSSTYYKCSWSVLENRCVCKAR